MKVVIMLYTNVCCKLTLGRLTGERYKCKLFTVHFGKSEISSGIRRGLSIATTYTFVSMKVINTEETAFCFTVV